MWILYKKLLLSRKKLIIIIIIIKNEKTRYRFKIAREKIMVVPTMETLPRVPDTHGDSVDEKLFSDLYIRTSWFDASIALDQIEKVRKSLNLLYFCLRIIKILNVSDDWDT